MIKKIKTVIYVLAIFQIFLLVNATFAYPYLIHQAEHQDSNASISNITKEVTKKAITLLGAILSIKQIGTVSAASLVMRCCTELKTGEICEDLPTESLDMCKNPLSLTECNQLDSCRLGCCRDPVEGTCSSRSPKGKCQASGGEWSSEEKCQISECQKGCCVLGSFAQFVNEKNCEKLSLLYGFEKDFKDLNTEVECLSLAASQEMGACVYEGKGCSFKTEKECLQNSGKFYKDYLCSHPSLETLCTKQASINCIDGKDEIYWFDSCGNRENIYSSDKTASWNNGKPLTKEQSCNPSSSNINSESCGNCNRALSSVCSNSSIKKVADGNFICKSLECKDEKGKTRKNGESWCLYDSYIGDGKDTVGSEHWLAYCYEGTVDVNLCGAYRGGICVQEDMESQGKKFSIAACNANDAYNCMDYNSDTDTVLEECQENKNCIIKQVRIADNFYFDVCSPKYPKGFDTDLYKSNKGICASVNTECTVIYVKDWKGRWKCEANCRCESKVFSDQMNDLCISLGDCGTYVNFRGKGTNNVVISGAPGITWEEYVSYAEPLEGQYAEPQNITKLLETFYSGVLPVGMEDDESAKKAAETIGKVSGGAGVLAWAGGWATGKVAVVYFSEALGTTGAASTSAFGTASTASSVSSVLGAVSSAAIGAVIGALVGSWLADSMGVSGTPATLMTISWAIAGAAVGYAYATGALATIYSSTLPIAATGYGVIIAVVIAVVVTLWIWFTGWGKTEKRIVSFKCLPWEAPDGGDDCTKCQDDPMKPCTEYRCKSLGQACVLLNNESEFPTCESLEEENVAPIISPGEAGKGYKFEDITENGLSLVGENKKCIPEFTPVSFTLETNEFAQCKYSYELPLTPDYEKMEGNYPDEGTAFTMIHNFTINMPSLSSLEASDLTGDLKEKFGKMSMYVKCKDYWGNYNINEYIVNFCINSGPDLMPINHLYTTMIPETGSILKYGTTKVNVSLYINEPAECKYSNSSGKNYDKMEYSFVCETDVLNPSYLGWECKTIMETPKEENKFYIKCKDQPWFAGTINETNRNINQDDYEYVLYVSESELNITDTSPKEIIENGFEPISVDLEVRTSGGAEEGKAICYWGENLDTFFWETNSATHKQTLSTVISGTYSIPIKCEDIAENVATSEINFSIELDTTPPMAVRAYREGSDLIVLTDEKAECYYTLNTCDFDTTEATSMTTALSTTHRAPWEFGKTYFIKCKDKWGNTNPWCAIRAQPG